jgi:hypothetical protein
MEHRRYASLANWANEERVMLSPDSSSLERSGFVSLATWATQRHEHVLAAKAAQDVRESSSPADPEEVSTDPQPFEQAA